MQRLPPRSGAVLRAVRLLARRGLIVDAPPPGICTRTPAREAGRRRGRRNPAPAALGGAAALLPGRPGVSGLLFRRRDIGWPKRCTIRGDQCHLMLDKFIASQSEVIRAIVSDHSLCCGVPHLGFRRPPATPWRCRAARASRISDSGCCGLRLQRSPGATLSRQTEAGSEAEGGAGRR